MIDFNAVTAEEKFNNRLTRDSPEFMLARMKLDQLRLQLKILNKEATAIESEFGSIGKVCPGCNRSEGGSAVKFGRNYARQDRRQVYCKDCRSRKEARGVHNTRSAGGVQTELQGPGETDGC